MVKKIYQIICGAKAGRKPDALEQEIADWLGDYSGDDTAAELAEEFEDERN